MFTSTHQYPRYLFHLARSISAHSGHSLSINNSNVPTKFVIKSIYISERECQLTRTNYSIYNTYLYMQASTITAHQIINAVLLFTRFNYSKAFHKRTLLIASINIALLAQVSWCSAINLLAITGNQ